MYSRKKAGFRCQLFECKSDITRIWVKSVVHAILSKKDAQPMRIVNPCVITALHKERVDRFSTERSY